MTREELKKIFGDSLTELKPVEIKPEHVETAKFKNLAVFMAKDCSMLQSFPAFIGEPEIVKCHGVIPMSKEYREKYAKLPPNERPFNCCVGDYYESQCAVTLDLSALSCKKARRVADIFGARFVYATAPGIYAVSVPEDSIGEFSVYDGIRAGFFRTEAGAKAAVNAAASEYREGLLAKLENIVTGDMLKATV